MKTSDDSTMTCPKRFTFNLGTFEGFNFRSQSAIERTLTADEVIAWDHDDAGEAEFWPSGDNTRVSTIFTGKTAVTGSELIALDELLNQLGGDQDENYLRIYHFCWVAGVDLPNLNREQIEQHHPNIYLGSSFTSLRQEAAYELFELNYPEAYAAWEKSQCDGLNFDVNMFLDSPVWSVDEVDLGDRKALIVAFC